MFYYKNTKNKNIKTSSKLHEQYRGDTSRACKYNLNVPATDNCFLCGAGLCSSCGYMEKGQAVCNECWEVKND